jgi:glycosyltransferase involved in cell wall biosynthesis
MGLHRRGQVSAAITLEPFARREDFEAADVVVFCRNIEPRFGHFVETCRQLGKPYIYDLDDNLFAVPLTLEEGQYHRDPARIEQLTRYLSAAALLRIYSAPLEQRVRGFNPRIERVTGSIDWALIPEDRPRPPSGTIKIVYATSRLEDELAATFLPDLEALLERHPGRVEICFWGHHPAKLRGRAGVRFRPLVPDYDRFLRALATAGFDIGLAPLLEDEFHRSKTNNKFREYGACGIAGVYSNVDVYSSCVTQGQTGLLVDQRPGAWLEAVEWLVLDAGLRASIQTEARDYVRRHYSQDGSEAAWLRQIEHVRAVARPLVVTGMTASVPPPEPFAVGRPHARVVLTEWAGRVTRLLRRFRRLGLRPTLYGVYRYLYGLRLLSRIERELAASRPGSKR